MKRILINSKITALSKHYAENIFIKRNFKGKRGPKFVMPLKNLELLEKKLRENINTIQYANYVKRIIDKYSILNAIKPKYFDFIHSRYFEEFTTIELDSKPIKGEKKKFYELIVESMRYDEVRTDFLPYARKLEIRACVYCNTQLAVTVGKDDISLRGMYELDHFYPKSKYPYLCTSFFNLQPTCSYCNKSKSDKKAMFNLYTSDFSSINPFSFQLKKASLIKYMLNQKCEDLEIDINSNEIDPKTGKKLIDDHNEHFHIKELYKTQRDLAEEIIWKAKVYNKSYQKSLSDSFYKLFPRRTDFNRFILGNYDRKEDIHKRPMAKFTQDIARQLKLTDTDR